MLNEPVTREKLAFIVIVLSMTIIAIVSAAAIISAPDGKAGEASEKVLTTLLPVLATWVGTVIAFYFGQKNFDAANRRVSELVKNIPAASKPKTPVSSIMRSLTDTKHIKGDDAGKLPIASIVDYFSDKVTRLLIINDSKAPMYLIHQSRIQGFLNEGGKISATLEEFLADRKSKKSISFGAGSGFVVVAQEISIEDAKLAMEAVSGCQDIIVTETGNSKDAVVGWISNTRLGRFLT